jgi:hypothetical protein
MSTMLVLHAAIISSQSFLPSLLHTCTLHSSTHAASAKSISDPCFIVPGIVGGAKTASMAQVGIRAGVRLKQVLE